MYTMQYQFLKKYCIRLEHISKIRKNTTAKRHFRMNLMNLLAVMDLRNLPPSKDGGNSYRDDFSLQRMRFFPFPIKD